MLMRKVMIVGILALLVVGSIANAFPLMKESNNHIPESSDGLQDSPWPMFCHDMRHTGRSEYDTSRNTGKEKWRFEMDNWVDSSPAIGDDGTIYVGSHDSYLYAVNHDGTLKWKFKTGTSIISSPAVDKNGIVYVGSMDGKLYAVNPDGTERWSIKMLSNQEYDKRYVESSPAIGKDGTVYIGSWFVSEKPSWGYLHAIKDGMPKGIEIVRPKQSYLYILDREIMKVSGPTEIIGWITIEPSIVSEENVDKVEFYVDYKYKYTDYSPPFEWTWNERIVGRFDPPPFRIPYESHQISVKAYYNDGDVVASKMKTVRIFNPFGKSLDIASVLLS
jgi:outer membrane protein assembly factor BamB